MKFARIIPGYDHLWAVRDESQKADELTRLFQRWNNANYLLDFFLANLEDLQGFFHIEKISDAIKDICSPLCRDRKPHSVKENRNYA